MMQKRSIILSITLMLVCVGALKSCAMQTTTTESKWLARYPAKRMNSVPPADSEPPAAAKPVSSALVHIHYGGKHTGPDIFVPYDQIGRNLAQLPSDKTTEIILICRRGNLGIIAAEALQKLGYSNVWLRLPASVAGITAEDC
jgi:rhodanese-related sulfurtransferase